MRNRPIHLSLFLTGCCFLLLVSCKDQEVQEEKQVSYIEENEQAFSKKIDLNSIPKIQLSQKAEEATTDWVEFMTVKSEMEKLEEYNLQKLVNNSKNLVESITQLRDSIIPDNFAETPVESRINVLATKAEILHQNTKHDQIDTAAIHQGGKDIYQAFGNLEIQLNELFLEGLPEFDIDMDRRQDSIRAAKEKKEEK